MKMRTTINNTLWCITFTLGLSACGGSSGGSDNNNLAGLAECAAPNDTQAVVCGRALATDGVTPLINAEVSLASSKGKLKNVITTAAKGVENPDKCLTDSTGDFVCLLPEGTSGSVTLKISLAGFDDITFTASANTGIVTDAGNQSLESNTDNKWVVVPGIYDGVQVLLAQLKGCVLNDSAGNPFDTATGKPENAKSSTDCENKGLLVLDTDSTSATYAPDFLASDKLAAYDSIFVNCETNLSSSTIDVALQAFVNTGKHIYFSDRSAVWLHATFPNKITFLGTNTEVGTLPATVLSTGLQSIVGTTMDVKFDIAVWVAIDSVTSDVTTFLEGDIAPLSNYTGTHPITVGWKTNTNAGCVFYTSYHIEGASQGSSQERAIKYLVQNIDSVCQTQ